MTAMTSLPQRVPNGLTVLDLCYGAGGLSMGYWLAGYDVVGIDLHPMPNYPFEFHQADALEYLAAITGSGEVERYGLVHASWPCQHFANVTQWRGSRDDHDDLLTPGRELLEQSGCPWVIENVPEAPLRPDYLLCGSQFGLNVRRHRAFETSWHGGGRAPPAVLAPQGAAAVHAQGRARVCRCDGLHVDEQDRGPPGRAARLQRVDRPPVPEPSARSSRMTASTAAPAAARSV